MKIQFCLGHVLEAHIFARDLATMTWQTSTLAEQQ